MEESRNRRLMIGCAILVLVNFVSVINDELNQYILHSSTDLRAVNVTMGEEEGNLFLQSSRPFLTTYLHAALFTLYLFGFLVNRAWREQCFHPNLMSEGGAVDNRSMERDIEMSMLSAEDSLSDPHFEPINYVGSSDPEDAPPDDPPQRGVRFAKQHEIRMMPLIEAREARLSRLPYELWLRAVRLAHVYHNRVPIAHVCRLSLVAAPLWLGLTYGTACLTDVHDGTISLPFRALLSTACITSVVMSAVRPANDNDRLTVSKLCVALLAVTGSLLVAQCTADKPLLSYLTLRDSAACIAIAISLSVYMLYASHELDAERMDIAMFVGFIGAVTVVCLWPVFHLLHLSGLEPFYPLPSRQQLANILINGILTAMLQHYLWLWGCLLTSSFIATLSLTLSLPMRVIADQVLWKSFTPWSFYPAALTIIASYTMAVLLAKYWNDDPLVCVLRRLVQSVLQCTRGIQRRTWRRSNRLREGEGQMHDSLIDNQL